MEKEIRPRVFVSTKQTHVVADGHNLSTIKDLHMIK